MLWRALRHVRNGFYIDVGANDPNIDSVTKLFYDSGWHGLNIEPVDVHHRSLQRERPLDINLKCAIGSSAGDSSIWISEVRGWATLERPVIEHHIAHGVAGQYCDIQTVTLTKVCEQYAPDEIHFLKIDVEGYEHRVLEGLDFSRFRPWIVVVEATRPNSQDEVHETWEPLLLAASYHFVYADGLNRFYVSLEHSELDTAFRYPPNFFDNFVKAPQIEGNRWAETIVAAATQANARAEAAQALAAQAQKHAEQAEASVQDALARIGRAEAHTKQAEARTLEAETRTLEAETACQQAQDRANDAHTSTLRAEARAANAQARMLQAESRATHAETCEEQAQSRAAEAQMCALQAQAATEQAHTRTLEAQHRADQAEAAGLEHQARISALLASTSWRASAPLRWLSDALRHAHQLLRTPLVLKKQTELSTDDRHDPPQPAKRRLKLAYVSPLPPQRSGIADYSAILIPALADFYDIDVVVDQSELAAPWISEHCGVRTAEWLIQNQAEYDRVLYHFGNSSYHQHMFKLLTLVPGVVVLHDFFLGDVLNYLEEHAINPFALHKALYTSHGYQALFERRNGCKLTSLLERYPANGELPGLARGVIVHSEHSRQLAKSWYAAHSSDNWSVIPLVRSSTTKPSRSKARASLGFKPDDFLVCSFGLMGATKLNRNLLEAWLASKLVHDSRCQLVFVGEEHGGEYGKQMRHAIEESGLGSRISISGWADLDSFTNYLAAADIAVQLRAHSRGETSAAVMDCMNHSLPLVVNAHGTFAELAPETAWILPEHFATEQLSQALETLWLDPERRSSMGASAYELIRTRHAPAHCAQAYASAIEHAYCQTHPPSPKAPNKTSAPIKPQLFVDVSATCRNDLKTGIQRVVRALVWELIQTPPAGYRVEPVYLTDEDGVWDYRYARKWTSSALGIDGDWMTDDSVSHSKDDVLLIADYTSGYAVEAERAGIFRGLKKSGVKIHFIVYDLLPALMPEHFPPGQFGFLNWLTALSRVSNSAICISEAVARDLTSWVDTVGPPRPQPLGINWFHLGADIQNSMPSSGLLADFTATLAALNQAPSFLMVGTIEPRKGYLQTIHAFTQLWQKGLDINLVIVGNEGWNGLPDEMRRSIPDILTAIREHDEFGKRLLWLKGISDECLELTYASCACLIAASEGEGFGLPLIEAAQHGLPIIARDIPVFKEVAQTHAFYFAGLKPSDLAAAITDWLALNRNDQAPQSDELPWQTWAQSTQSLVEKLNLRQPL